MAETSRWGISYPEGTDAPDVPKWMKDMALDLDDHAKDDQGLLSARPTSTVGTPGKKGRYYYATDAEILYRDNGTGWDIVSACGTDMGFVAQGSSLSFTEEGFKDVPSLSFEITPKVESKLLVIATFDFRAPVAAVNFNGRFEGTIQVDGGENMSPRAQAYIHKDGSGAGGGAHTRSYVVTLSAAKHTIKGRVQSITGNNLGYNCQGSTLHWSLIPA